jgi:hypothetical protein
MRTRKIHRWEMLSVLGVLAGVSPLARAQVAVIDVAALSQLLSQVQSLEQ